MIKNVHSDADIDACFEVMRELRPQLNRDSFVTQVRRMEAEGFRMACIEKQGKVVAVAGYRIYMNLFLGKHLYVDDLVSAESERSRGHGANLLGWLRELAKTEGCNYFHLDSGVQRTRAHAFYFREGMHIASYHFVEDIRPCP